MPIPKADDTAARKAALDVLNKLDQTSELLDTVLATRAAELCLDFSASDRKLVNAIVYGVLRWRRRLDWIIKQYAAMPVSRISPRIMNILRMAVFQIIYLDRVPDFAVVNTSVEMAKQLVSVKSSRFVNGILRNILRHPLTAFETSLPTDPIQSLAISQSFPD